MLDLTVLFLQYCASNESSANLCIVFSFCGDQGSRYILARLTNFMLTTKLREEEIFFREFLSLCNVFVIWVLVNLRIKHMLKGGKILKIFFW